MRYVGLTGGIGSGKSTVGRLLADRGAVVVDADALARDAVAPGTPGFDAVVAHFGSAVLKPDGSLDRPALARVVFADPDERANLEAVVHPVVRLRIAEVLAAHAGTDDVVVLDSPLLIETGAHADCDVVMVVTAPDDARVDRLVARGMDVADVRARIAAQMPLADKAALADVVVDNAGSPEDLAAEVGRLWDRLRADPPKP
jgi:dephospho-CoA kinase